MADDAPPPAYDENATVVEDAPPADDGKATETAPMQETQPTQTETEPKPKREDKPPEEGEGAFGSPLLRSMFFGVVILLYAILAFWMPVYWMAGAANPCQFRCNTYPEFYSGCYGSDDLNCDENCETECDVINDNDALRDEYYDIYAALYLGTSRGAILAGWTFITLGIAFMAVGCIFAYFAQKKGNQIFQYIALGGLGLGGLFEVIGAFIFTTSFDGDYIDESIEGIWGGVRSAIWLEFVFPGVMAIIFASDIFKLTLNTPEMRVYLLTVPVAIVGFFGGIVLAYVINWEPDPSTGYDFELYDALGCASAGYFIMGIIAVIRILIVKDMIKLNDPAQAITIKFTLAIFMVIGGFICAVGYWAFIDGLFDCSSSLLGSTVCEAIGYLQYMYGDSIGYYAPIADIGDVNYEGQCKAYYVGYSFFIIGLTVILAYDMDIVDNYKKVRAAQAAASAASSTPTDGNAAS